MADEASARAEETREARRRRLVSHPALRRSAAAAALCLVFTLASLLSFVPVEEDAYISFRHAENLARGHGPVFNISPPHTEGYTNFLWVVILAGADLAGWDVPHAAKILGWIAGMAALMLAMRLGERLCRERMLIPFLAALILALQPPFVFWCQRGLETGLLLALSLATVLRWDTERRSHRARPWSALLAVLLVMTRPDAAPVAALPMISHVCDVAFRPPARRRGLIALGVFAVPMLAWLAMKVALYGGVLPNSFHFKTDRPLGEKAALAMDQIRALVAIEPLVWAAPLGALALLPLRRRDRSLQRVALAGLLIFATLLYTGGDDPWRLPHRFTAPLLPFVAVLAGGVVWRGLCGLQRRGMPLALRVWALLVGVGVAAAALWPRMEADHWKENFHVDRVLARPALIGDLWDLWWSRPLNLIEPMAEEIVARVGPNATIALNHVGRIPYHTGYETLDTLGLCSKEALALHARGGWDAVLDHVIEEGYDVVIAATFEVNNLLFNTQFQRHFAFLVCTRDWIVFQRRAEPLDEPRSFRVEGGLLDDMWPWDLRLLGSRLQALAIRQPPGWREAFDQGLDWAGVSLPIMRLASETLMQEGEVIEALEFYERGKRMTQIMTHSDPFDAGYWHGLAIWAQTLSNRAGEDMALRARLMEEARAHAQRAVDWDPLDPGPRATLESIMDLHESLIAKERAGERLMEQDWEGALGWARRAAESRPHDAEAHLIAAMALLQLQRPEEAVPHWSLVASWVTDENLREPLWERAMSHLRAQGVSMAEALRRGEATAWQCHLVADWLLRTEEPRQALEAWTLAIELDPSLAEYRLRRGHTHLELGEAEEALGDAEAALAVDPDHPWGHLYRAMALEALQRPNEALESLERYLATEPGSRDQGALQMRERLRGE